MSRLRMLRGRAAFAVVAVTIAVGVFTGLGLFTFGYGEGTSYLKDDPASCANCHVMQEPYDTWQKSSHHGVATCNDCHLSPHPVGKWVTKVDNGFFHSLAFTTNDFDEPIRVKPRNREVTQKACLSCHGDFVEYQTMYHGGDAPHCARCHSDVGHSQRR